MRVPAQDSLHSIPELGPYCAGHNEPTVLKVLNGRKMYVCNRFPFHHCRTCCPIDVMLLDQKLYGSPPQHNTRSINNNPSLFGSPIGSSPIASPLDIAAPSRQSNDNIREINEELTSPSPQLRNATTPRNYLNPNNCTPSLPPAPSKPQCSQDTAVTSRDARYAGAARSLIPIFNNFAPAAARATQLGGRFAMLRPHASHIARLQRQVSQSMDEVHMPSSSLSSVHMMISTPHTSSTTTIIHVDNTSNTNSPEQQQHQQQVVVGNDGRRSRELLMNDDGMTHTSDDTTNNTTNNDRKKTTTTDRPSRKRTFYGPITSTTTTNNTTKHVKILVSDAKPADSSHSNGLSVRTVSQGRETRSRACKRTLHHR